jgi:hypothetical protein
VPRECGNRNELLIYVTDAEHPAYLPRIASVVELGLFASAPIGGVVDGRVRGREADGNDRIRALREGTCDG